MSTYEHLPGSGDRAGYRNLDAHDLQDYTMLEEEDYEHDHVEHQLSEQRPAEVSNKARYIYAALALAVCLVTFVIQTESAGYLATTLNYKKPIFMLYITHSSWTLLWPLQILFLRIRKWHLPFHTFMRLHMENVVSTAQMIVDVNEEKESGIYKHQHRHHSHPPVFSLKSPLFEILKVCSMLFVALSVAGSSWYVAINLTTTSDITAIYNCSAFFAYAFSVPLLREPFRWDKSLSVIMAMIGVFIVAYGGERSESKHDSEMFPHRLFGNFIIGIGAVLYGLYEVLYKRLACPPSAVSPRRQAVFANVVGSGIGFCTLTMLWVLIPILHITGWETFQLPRGNILWVLILSVVTNMLFSGGMLVLMSLTSPVLSSVAALLTIFIVAIVDWLVFGTPISMAGMLGGIIIIIAFVVLSYATWIELSAEEEEGQSIEREYMEQEYLRD